MGKVDGSYAASECWQVVKPTGSTSTNLVSNPSFEVSTDGWSDTSGALTRVSGGKFGGWMGSLLASAQYGRAETTLPAVASASSNVASSWIRATSSQVYLAVIIGATTQVQTHPGDGEWHRLEVPITAPSATTPVISLQDGRTSGWDAVELDGVQFETGRSVATTYIDGDQDGCTWTGSAGLSQSTRSGRDGRGGEIVSLESLGLLVMQNLGIGAPPVEVETNEAALSDGEIFQRSRNKPRVITLMSMIEGDGGLASLHTVRRGLLDVLRPDARTGRGPITLRYSASEVPKLLPAYYTGGLEMDGIEAADEKIPLRFVAPAPDFVGETDEQVALDPQNTITTNLITQRSAAGVWHGLNGGVDTATEVLAIELGDDGLYYVGGNWTGGAASSDHLAKYDPSSDTWSLVGGVSPDSNVSAIARTLDGKIFIGGSFANVGSAMDLLTLYDPVAGTFAAIGTTPAALALVNAVAVDANNNLWVLGQDGALAAVAYYWNGSSWTSVASGLVTGSDLALGPDGLMYLAGGSVRYWSGSTWTSIGTASGGNATGLVWAPDGRLYACGAFTSIGGVTASKVARWNGTTWEAMGSGLAAGDPQGLALAPDGTVYVVGQNFTTAGGITLPDSVAVWNGSSWLPADIALPGSATQVRCVHISNAGVVTLGMGNASSGGAGSATTPGTAVATNTGSSVAYPVIQIAGAATIYAIENLTTKQIIRFNAAAIYATETLTIDLRPGQKTVKTQRRNLMSRVLVGSDLATFCLAPGDNTIALYTSSSSISASMRWRARYWSAD